MGSEGFALQSKPSFIKFKRQCAKSGLHMEINNRSNAHIKSQIKGTDERSSQTILDTLPTCGVSREMIPRGQERVGSWLILSICRSVNLQVRQVEGVSPTDLNLIFGCTN